MKGSDLKKIAAAMADDEDVLFLEPSGAKRSVNSVSKAEHQLFPAGPEADAPGAVKFVFNG